MGNGSSDSGAWLGFESSAPPNQLAVLLTFEPADNKKAIKYNPTNTDIAVVYTPENCELRCNSASCKDSFQLGISIHLAVWLTFQPAGDEKAIRYNPTDTDIAVECGPQN